LPVGLIWGVGPVTEERLAARGIVTVGDLAATPSRTVERLLGAAVGQKLHAMAADHDPRKVAGGRRAHSVGAQSAIGRRGPPPKRARPRLGRPPPPGPPPVRGGRRGGRHTPA
ncbi:MAG TPA: DNA polymerase IV, partial [Actinotalea sp.]|nr:DNA polymerase IV [Actinotalea sp.]